MQPHIKLGQTFEFLSFMWRQLSREYQADDSMQYTDPGCWCCCSRAGPPLAAVRGWEDDVKLAACVHDEILLLVKEPHAEKWAQILKEVMEGSGLCGLVIIATC